MISERRGLAERVAELSPGQRAALARRLAARRASAGAGAGAPVIPRRPAGEQPPLSFAQWRLWFLDQLDPGSPAYNSPVVVSLDGPLEVAALRGALELVVARHEALRTAIVCAGGEPRAVVHDRALPELALEDLPTPSARHGDATPSARHGDATPSARHGDATPSAPPCEAELQRRIRTEIRRPFDLGAPPLVRGRLWRLGPERHVLALVAHHIALDGWSKAILLSELGRAHDALRAGAQPRFSELPIQYGDFARWQRATLAGEPLRELERFWSGALAGHPERLALPVDHPRPPRLRGAGAVEWISVPAEHHQRLRAIGRSVGATPFMTMLGALAALLALQTGAEDILIGAPAAMREPPETEPLIGFFANTLVYRIDASADPSLRELVARARRGALAVYAHRELPFEQIVRVARPRRRPGGTPLVQVNLRLEGPEPELALAGLRTRRMAVDPGIARFELALELSESAEGLDGYLEYSTELFAPRTAGRLAEALLALLRAGTHAPDAPLSALGRIAGGR
jgi:hypothetical protein